MPLRTSRKATPVAVQTIPGTRNAARHPMTAVRPPATSEAEAMPAEPKTPLMPSALPRAFAFATIHAVPTG